MKNTFGSSVAVTLFGESHGEAVGAVIDGLAPGIPVDPAFIEKKLALRRPDGRYSTSRIEKDAFRLVSGVFEGHTTGAPLCILIENTDTRSGDYSRALPRPSHADYPAFVKYHGFEDYRGGGHFSGRLTAPLVAAGAIAQSALLRLGIRVGTHLKELAGIPDRPFGDLNADIAALSEKPFAVLDENAGNAMKNAVEKAAKDGDSVGGVLETAVTGVPAGLGEPWFDTVEGLLAHALFAIPAVKGVSFGDGFALARMTGSAANDPLRTADGRVYTETNHAGGIGGGVTNGMPLIFSTAVKPTPTIFKEQHTVDLAALENTTLTARGRHDPAVAVRARAAVDALTALTLCDLLALRFGTDHLRGEQA